MDDIEKLQEKIAYQERTIDALNEALASQQQQISRLQDEVKVLAQVLREWRSESRQGDVVSESGSIHEIPPHY